MAIKLNEVWAVVYFSNNYTKSLDGRVLLNTKFSLKKEILHNISFDFSDVIVWQDMSSKKNRFRYLFICLSFERRRGRGNL